MIKNIKWGNDGITDYEFQEAMKFLIEHGIIISDPNVVPSNSVDNIIDYILIILHTW